MEAELPALPLIPTLLLHKSESLTLNLIRLAKELRSSNKNDILFNLLLENQLHISKSKALKKIKEKLSKNDLVVKEQLYLSEEEIFLQDCIKKEITLEEICSELDLRKKGRTQWPFHHLYLYELLRRLPETLGHFLSIRIIGRNWWATDWVYDHLSRSAFFKQKIDGLVRKVRQDPKSIEKMPSHFQRNLLIALKNNEGIEEVLETINYSTLFKFKDEDPQLLPGWQDFLCSQIKSNGKLQKPTIRLKNRRFTLKWSKIKKPGQNDIFQWKSKLDYIIRNKVDIESCFIDDVEQILIRGVINKETWPKVKSKVVDFVDEMNSFESDHVLEIGRKSRIFSDASQTYKTQFSDFTTKKDRSFFVEPEHSFRSQRVQNKYQSQIIFPKTTQNYGTQTEKKQSSRQNSDRIEEAGKKDMEKLYFLQVLKEKITQFEEKVFKNITPEERKRFYEDNKEELARQYQSQSCFFFGMKETILKEKDPILKKIIASTIILDNEEDTTPIIKSLPDFQDPFQTIPLDISQETIENAEEAVGKSLDRINSFIRTKKEESLKSLSTI